MNDGKQDKCNGKNQFPFELVDFKKDNKIFSRRYFRY